MFVSNVSAMPWYKGEGNKREKVSVHRVIPRKGFGFKKPRPLLLLNFEVGAALLIYVRHLGLGSINI